MRYIVLGISLLFCAPAGAVGLCMAEWDMEIHPAGFGGSKQYTDQTGRFRIGYTLNGGHGYQKPIMYGESWCSAATTRDANNWDEYGDYCWCRFTYIAPTNGSMAAFNGQWVFRQKWNQYQPCSAHCSGYCADFIRGGQERLRAMIVPAN